MTMIHFVNYHFGNRIRLCDKMINGKIDDTTDYTYEVTCKKCIKIIKKEKTERMK